MLTAKGKRRVEEDSVLEPSRLALALDGLADTSRHALLKGMEQLASLAEELDDHPAVSR